MSFNKYFLNLLPTVGSVLRLGYILNKINILYLSSESSLGDNKDKKVCKLARKAGGNKFYGGNFLKGEDIENGEQGTYSRLSSF